MDKKNMLGSFGALPPVVAPPGAREMAFLAERRRWMREELRRIALENGADCESEQPVAAKKPSGPSI